MGSKQKEDEHINEVLRDWKLLAQKADYFLFWVFFTITTVTRSVLTEGAGGQFSNFGPSLGPKIGPRCEIENTVLNWPEFWPETLPENLPEIFYVF